MLCFKSKFCSIPTDMRAIGGRCRHLLLGRVKTSDLMLPKCATAEVPSPWWTHTNTVLQHLWGCVRALNSTPPPQQAATLALVKAQSTSACEDAAGCCHRTHLLLRHHQAPQVLQPLRQPSTRGCHAIVAEGPPHIHPDARIFKSPLAQPQTATLPSDLFCLR